MVVKLPGLILGNWGVKGLEKSREGEKREPQNKKKWKKKGGKHGVQWIAG